MTDDGAPLQVDEERVLTTSSIDGLADEWDDLALRTGAPPFARPGWVRAWWAAFGRGELRILTARRNGALSSVLPLARFRGGLHSCSNIHSPAFDGVSADPEGLQILLTAALRESRKGLIMSGLEAEGQVTTAARQVARESRCRLVVLDKQIARYIDPAMRPSSWQRS